mmetsp:Transcript_15328/g.22948  ORF Transcript_15328/g.22948 Transcript_15328/m.22948 type:complete len:146 (+) Transcript_15328:28-465(+)
MPTKRKISFAPCLLKAQLIQLLEEEKLTVKGLNAKILGILGTLLIHGVALKNIQLINNEQEFIVTSTNDVVLKAKNDKPYGIVIDPSGSTERMYRSVSVGMGIFLATEAYLHSNSSYDDRESHNNPFLKVYRELLPKYTNHKRKS